MWRLRLAVLTALLTFCPITFGQDCSDCDCRHWPWTNECDPCCGKKITGTISGDGKSITTDKDKKSWTIVNPEFLKGHEGRHVLLGVKADKNNIKVITLAGTKDDMKKDNLKK